MEISTVVLFCFSVAVSINYFMLWIKSVPASQLDALRMKEEHLREELQDYKTKTVQLEQEIHTNHIELKKLRRMKLLVKYFMDNLNSEELP